MDKAYVYRPIANAIWLVLSLLVLLCAAKLEITDGNKQGTRHSWFEFFLLKYRGPLKISPAEQATSLIVRQPTPAASSNEASLLPAHSSAVPPAIALATLTSVVAPSMSADIAPPIAPTHYCLTLTMRFANGWTYYQTFTDALAMGVYLYGTVVFASTIFVTSVDAMLILFPLTVAQIPIHFMARRWAPRLAQRRPQPRKENTKSVVQIPIVSPNSQSRNPPTPTPPAPLSLPSAPAPA